MTDEIAISHLQRRKIEGRVLIPFIAACREKFGDGPTREMLAAAIRALATQDGARWAESFGPDIAGMASTLLTVCVAITELIDLAVSGMGCGEFALELRDLKLHWFTIRADLEARAAEESAE